MFTLVNMIVCHAEDARQEPNVTSCRTLVRTAAYSRLGQRADVSGVVLVLVAFGYRLWRLDEPRSMHFDEVYHARSAMPTYAA